MRRKQAQLALFNEEEEEDDLGGRVKVTMKDNLLIGFNNPRQITVPS